MLMLIELSSDFAGTLDSRNYRLVDASTGASYGTHIIAQIEAGSNGQLYYSSILEEKA